ncbi:hypothetical protein GGR50DRAFT_698343 [Xylaria sp. CBS 124048]|nr:hypothetical protein GGR50DRAFT_698343 [Xylaria sp. CBS 124048]
MIPKLDLMAVVGLIIGVMTMTMAMDTKPQGYGYGDVSDTPLSMSNGAVDSSSSGFSPSAILPATLTDSNSILVDSNTPVTVTQTITVSNPDCEPDTTDTADSTAIIGSTTRTTLTTSDTVTISIFPPASLSSISPSPSSSISSSLSKISIISSETALATNIPESPSVAAGSSASSAQVKSITSYSASFTKASVTGVSASITGNATIPCESSLLSTTGDVDGITGAGLPTLTSTLTLPVSESTGSGAGTGTNSTAAAATTHQPTPTIPVSSGVKGLVVNVGVIGLVSMVFVLTF